MKNNAFRYHIGIIRWVYYLNDWIRLGDIAYENSKKKAIDHAKMIWKESNKNLHASTKTVLERVIVVDSDTGRIIFESLNMKPLIYGELAK